MKGRVWSPTRRASGEAVGASMYSPASSTTRVLPGAIDRRGPAREGAQDQIDADDEEEQ